MTDSLLLPRTYLVAAGSAVDTHPPLPKQRQEVPTTTSNKFFLCLCCWLRNERSICSGGPHGRAALAQAACPAPIPRHAQAQPVLVGGRPAGKGKGAANCRPPTQCRRRLVLSHGTGPRQGRQRPQRDGGKAGEEGMCGRGACRGRTGWLALQTNTHTHSHTHTRTHAHRLLWGRRSGWVGAGMSRDGHDLVYTIDSPAPSPSPHPLLHVGLVGEQTWGKAAAERACACGCRSLLLLLLLCLAPISRCINRDQWREEALKIRQKCVLEMGAGGCRAFSTFSLPNLVVVVLPRAGLTRTRRSLSRPARLPSSRLLR